MRLLDCLGFTTPAGFFPPAAVFVEVVGLRFGGGGGSEAGCKTGEDRNAVGDGMVMVSISTIALTHALNARLPLSLRMGSGCFDGSSVVGIKRS